MLVSTERQPPNLSIQWDYWHELIGRYYQFRRSQSHNGMRELEMFCNLTAQGWVNLVWEDFPNLRPLLDISSNEVRCCWKMLCKAINKKNLNFNYLCCKKVWTTFLFSLKKIFLRCCHVKTVISECMIPTRRRKSMEVCQLIYMDGVLFSLEFVMLMVLSNSFKCVIGCVISSFTVNIHISIYFPIIF